MVAANAAARDAAVGAASVHAAIDVTVVRRGRAHIILVHGTFARSAEWTREDAPLRRHLADALGVHAATTTIEAFEWNGHNTFKARREAALGLQRAIRRIVADDANARIYIVGHSHGGNIALRAVVDPDIADRVDGIVCLATPVIHSSLVMASDAAAGRAIRAWTTMAALVPVALLADRLAIDGVASWIRGSPSTLVALIVASVAALLALVVLTLPRLPLFRRIDRYNRRAAVRLDAVLRPPPIDPSRIVFVRHASDEATMTANFLGLIGWLSDRAAAILEARYRRLDALLGTRAGRRLTIAFGLASLALIVFFQFVRALEPRIVVFGILFLVLSVPPLVTLILRAARAIGTMRTLFFGVAVVPVGSFIRMSIEPVPPGEWTVVMLPKPLDEAVATPIVDAHSRVYQQPEFLAFVSAWIAGRIARR